MTTMQIRITNNAMIGIFIALVMLFGGLLHPHASYQQYIQDGGFHFGFMTWIAWVFSWLLSLLMLIASPLMFYSALRNHMELSKLLKEKYGGDQA